MTIEQEQRAVRPLRRSARVLGRVLLTLLVLVLVALAIAWTQRKPIATDIVARELQRRGVPARFRITAIGARTQRIEDLVIGDPARPDLTARSAEVSIAIGLHGPEVSGIRAEGLRLNARYSGGRLSLGAIDRLLAAPSTSAGPITLPAIRLDLHDARMLVTTDWGAFGIALEGHGALQDGFAGRAAIVSRLVRAAGCEMRDVRAVVDVAIADRAPMVDGPIRAVFARCAGMSLDDPVVALDTRLSAGFDRWHGGARIEAAAARLPGIIVANPALQIGFDGGPAATRGGIDASAATIETVWAQSASADLSGKFVLAAAQQSFVGHGRLHHAAARDAIAARVLASARAAAASPAGPVAAALAASAAAAMGDADVESDLAILNRGDAGAALEIEHPAFRSASGARIGFDGRVGLRLAAMTSRVEGRATVAGGGLPDATIVVRQPRAGGPVSVRARIATMTKGDASLAPGILAIDTDPAGSIRFALPLRLDGPVGASGRIDGLTATIAGRYRNGAVTIGEACQPVAFDRLTLASFRLGRTARSLCPIGPAMLVVDARGAHGGVKTGAVVLAGAIGSTPLTLAVHDLAVTLPDARFTGHRVQARIGAGGDPTTLTAATLGGAANGVGLAGDFAGGGGKIANVPFVFSGAGGRWRYAGGALAVQASGRVADAASPERFHPLAAPDFSLRLAGNAITATGHLVEPKSKAAIARLAIDHDLGTASGRARIDVGALAFGPKLQPEAITPLTVGIVANIVGQVRGSGLVRWSPKGVTSEGDFAIDKVDLAAAFGQVSGISGTIHFDDLIGLTTPPGQEAHIAAINPGIEVADGVIRYQLLADRKVGIESGRWPFAGGTLTLQPTLLDFTEAAVRHMTLAVAGLDGAKFIDQMKFENIDASGLFDGSLPLVFDKTGGRIVGGSLVARPPGGTISYVGEVSNAQLGTFGKLAFDALKSLRYKTLAIALDGSLDGEVVSQIKVNGVNQQPVGGRIGPASKQLTGLPFRFNIQIKAPFRGLMNSARTFADPSALIRAQATDPSPPQPVQPK